MVSLHTAWVFFGIALLLAYAPGPDNLFVLVLAAAHGRRAGFCVVLGLCTGLLVHTAAVALGLAALFAASPTAFQIVRWTGAAYLMFLSWSAFRTGISLQTPAAQGTTPNLRRMFIRGVLMNLTNPKVIIFFLALLPQFVKPSAGPPAFQLIQLGLIFIAATLVAFGSITLFAGWFGERFLRSPAIRRTMSFVTAAVFLALAARIALAST